MPDAELTHQRDACRSSQIHGFTHSHAGSAHAISLFALLDHPDGSYRFQLEAKLAKQGRKIKLNVLKNKESGDIAAGSNLDVQV